MMVSSAVLIHLSIVGVGAIWSQPIKVPSPDAMTTLVFEPPIDPGVRILSVSNEAPIETPDPSTPTPQTSVPSDLSPAAAVPEMPELSDATPPPRSRHISLHAPHTLAPINTVHAVTSGSNGLNGIPGAATGSSGVGKVGALEWKTPKPPYPRTVLASGFQGATTVRITTDANGNIATVEIVRSAGNLLLDHNTQAYVREFWKGPPNATRTTQFVYQIP